MFDEQELMEALEAFRGLIKEIGARAAAKEAGIGRNTANGVRDGARPSYMTKMAVVAWDRKRRGLSPLLDLREAQQAIIDYGMVGESPSDQIRRIDRALAPIIQFRDNLPTGERGPKRKGQ